MFRIGPIEALVCLAIVLLCVGATRVPKLAKSLGESVKIFKKSVKEDNTEESDNVSDEEK